jgi:hypothetical protein
VNAIQSIRLITRRAREILNSHKDIAALFRLSLYSIEAQKKEYAENKSRYDGYLIKNNMTDCLDRHTECIIRIREFLVCEIRAYIPKDSYTWLLWGF